MVGELVGISRAHAYQLLRRYKVEHDAVVGSSKGYLPETGERFKAMFEAR